MKYLVGFAAALLLCLLLSEPAYMQDSTNSLYLPLVAGKAPYKYAEEVRVPTGSFEMGCELAYGWCAPDEMPLHMVVLNTYYIDKYEVTNARYQACVDAGACSPPFAPSATETEYYTSPEYSDYPIINATWNEASRFCAWDKKRLPTEAEWEKAARGDGAVRKYPWGSDTPTCGLSNYWIGQTSGCNTGTRRAGSYPDGESPYEVMDMSGNVSEWVADIYSADYYKLSTTNNPQGPSAPPYGTPEHVLRGGSWHSLESELCTYCRSAESNYQYANATGFRCARTPETVISGLSAKSSGPTHTGSTTYFTATVNSGKDVEYFWDLGDGTNETGANITHTYQTEDVYSIVVTATNTDSFATAQITMLVEAEVFIPAGEFMMGCTNCAPYEGPTHTVHLDAYFIDKYEATNREYQICVDDGHCTEPSSQRSSERTAYYKNPEYADFPVVLVSWNQALAFCTWAGKRLPTEAEWEKAARGTEGRIYPWGDEVPDCTKLNFKDVASRVGFCVGDTSEVGSYPTGASPYGAMDMAGNVWEWVNDWYLWDYYNVSPRLNPNGPDTGVFKVARGGSYYGDASEARTDIRISINPEASNYLNIGFRCAR